MLDIDQASFEAELLAAGDDLSPLRAGLLFARDIGFPDLRPSDYIVKLEDLLPGAHAALAPHADPARRGLALAEHVFQGLGFRGDERNYYDPRNSFLNEVMDRRRGIPITLSVIYLELGRRLELPVAGVGLPGHFIVSVAAASGPIYLDAFNGGARLTPDDCARLVRSASGYTGAFDPRWLEPTPPRDIVGRMLNNLRAIYAQLEDWARAIRVIEHLRRLQPNASSHLRDLGLLHYRNGALRVALRFLDQYLAREPNAADFDSVRQSRELLLDHLAQLN